jgi:hypothetical protein
MFSALKILSARAFERDLQLSESSSLCVLLLRNDKQSHVHRSNPLTSSVAR